MEALKTAQVASEEAEAAAEQAAIAAEAVKTATETAKAAQTYAEAQALAQSAQLYATLAQQAVEVAKAKAEEVFAAFQKDPTAENFAKLVKEYSEDTGSVENGGLYENITKDYMVEEFDAWIFDAARKNGDCEIVKTDYGYHIMFFEGVSDPAWKISVETAMKNEAYTAAYDEFKKEIKVTVDDKKLGKLPF